MSSRRRGEDMSLYDFAKKYQENQSSTDLVKKQNASEDKVLSSRLEYLNNQKVLTMKTLEKEIDLIKRRKMYGWDGSRKNSVSSHHFDRASLPNTPRRWTKHNFSPAKFVKRESLPQSVSRKQKHRVRNNKNICERETSPSIEQKENEDNNPHVVNVMQAAVNTNIATLPTETAEHDVHVVIQATLQTEKQAILGSSEKPDQSKSFPNPTFKNKGRFSNNVQNTFPSWSRYSHKKQNLPKQQDTKNDEPEQRINGSSVNLKIRQIPSRFHHPHNVKLELNDPKLNSLLDMGGGLKDLRFKNLESVLIPH